MGAPDVLYPRTSGKDAGPLAAAWDQLRLAHFRFRLTYGLVCQTPGEELATHLICLCLLVGIFWLSYRTGMYCLCALARLLPDLTDPDSVRAMFGISTAAAKSSVLLEGVQTSLQATWGGELTPVAAFAASNASVFMGS